MRIRIFRAFASNNSGSYTIVGSFGDARGAEDAARLLANLCAQHDAWLEARTEGGESPLDVFAREHGLSQEAPGRDEDWPEYGEPPKVLAVGRQVLLHVPYTVTMPRLLGEFFYKRGGRVDVELDHAHEQLAAEISFLVPDLGWTEADREERRRRIEQVHVALRAILPDLCARPEHEQRPAIAPVYHEGSWGEKQIFAVFPDLVDGVEGVRRVAAQHGVQIHVRISECCSGSRDPLLHLRTGKARVILWSLGADRVAALRVLRELLGSELPHAQAILERLPQEVLVDVEQARADRAVEVLRQAGCDAESVVAVRTES